MNKVYACIDGQPGAGTVTDWAAWSASRLGTPLELLHALERKDGTPGRSDFSGAIGLGSQEALLQEMSELDAQRSKLAQDAGRHLLAAARQRAQAMGVPDVEVRMRHDELVDTLLEFQSDARLYVMGRRGDGATPSKRHLDHHVERVVRSVKRPVLVVSGEHFAPPTRFVIAFDGSEAARKTVATVAGSPLLAGLPVLLAMAGDDGERQRAQLAEAARVLQAAGFAVESDLRSGEPEDVIPTVVASTGASLLVMGAYGHSRVRELLVGSTTTALLRLSPAPVLILR